MKSSKHSPSAMFLLVYAISHPLTDSSAVLFRFALRVNVCYKIVHVFLFLL